MRVNQPRSSRWLWRPNLSNRQWTIAIFASLAVTLFLLFSPISLLRKFDDSNATLESDPSDLVPFTPLSKAQQNSAFCLDGSVPGYHMRRGFGSGSRSWLLHVEDEIFHVPQAQRQFQELGSHDHYSTWTCIAIIGYHIFRKKEVIHFVYLGFYIWRYFLSLPYVASLFPGLLCLQTVASFSDACSTSVLRFTNIVLAVICSVLVYEIITHLRPSLDDKKATFQALVVSLYPLHWFFSFLYYTDVASLTAVLAVYLLTLKKKYLLSSLFGALSVLIRQTNIIWMLFVACTGVLEFIRCHQKDILELSDFSTSRGKDVLSVDNRGVSTISKLRQRRIKKGVDNKNDLTSQTSLREARSSGLLDEIQDIIVISWHHLWELLVSFSPFFMVLVAFVAFVCWNGSIVLGAKDAHAVSPHFAQLLYYSMISALFMFPVHLLSLDQTAEFFHQFRKNKWLTAFQWFVALSLGFLFVNFFSVAHPYLLSDNRHYPFYLWRKVINYHWSTKYIMVPLYIYSWFSIFSNLAKSQKKTWILVYFLACAATLVPAPLIEFRYYTIPFVFLILHTRINNKKTWLLMGILYLSVNCFTAFMFLFRPFSWKHEAGTQRFIW